MLIKLARLSLWNRRATALLTLLSLVVSVALLLGIDHLRHQAKDSFGQTLSGTDLIVGARGGQLNLLLYSVFRMGNPTNNISWQSYQELAGHRAVAWTLPLSLGDSHRGFRVLGTTPEYFEHYRYGQRRNLSFAQGAPFEDVYDAVLGARVARELGYSLGEEIVIAHGLGAVSFARHEDKPFTVVGILAPTGTPVDRTVHVSLEGIEAIHIGWQDGAPPRPGRALSPEEAAAQDLTPESITAVLVGLNSRAATFALQRQINDYRAEPLMAVLPGVALSELWQMLAMVENLLLLISAMVLLAALIGMVTTLLASMKERQREMAVLRAVGASPFYLFVLVELEVILLALLGVLGGIALLALGLWLAQPLLLDLGLFVSINPLQAHTAVIAAVILGLAALSGLVPAIAAYRRVLSEGLSPRV